MIDRFAANFRETTDGQIIFQPPKAKIGVPVTWEEYEAVTSSFERMQMENMAITWAVFIAAGAFGIYYVIAEDRYLPFFLALGMAFLFSSALNFRDGLGLLLPFIQRRDELLKVRGMGTDDSMSE
ncbi:hypothetical protein [Porphyrobacter sp. HT-58-2]|uniref:hypothetical protein n=1 Tax=Porphyrobacter sp. HT-58-2 TaxID=2023229 RepID=UPI0011B0F28D|nr:hypothetical protein [Porphyrobacter sp. HT-58-2]